MNAKKAKFLRKIARRAGSTAQNQYTPQQHRARLLPTGRLNADGTPQQVVFTPVTLRYEATCPRGVYRALKKLNK